MCTDGFDIDISLLPLVWDNSDQELLISEQQSDPTLSNIRQWARENSKGFSITSQGVIVHTDSDSLGIPYKELFFLRAGD